MLGQWRKAVIFLSDFEFEAHFLDDPYAVRAVKVFLENPVADKVGSFVDRFQTWGFNNFRRRFRASLFSGITAARKVVCGDLAASGKILVFI